MPSKLECMPCNCPTKLEVCPQCDFVEMGCVDVEQVNRIINLTNLYVKVYNENTGSEEEYLGYYSTWYGEVTE